MKTETSLMWFIPSPPSQMTWHDAVVNVAIASCGGYMDWRLPTINELKSLFILKPDVCDGYAWTRTSISGTMLSLCALSINSMGCIGIYGKDSPTPYVLAVRRAK